MKKFNLTGLLILLLGIFSVQLSFSQTTTNTYIDRFLQIRARIHDANSGYFSKDGAPYHSVETLMCEAPDQGHESTSEAYSFYIWLEAMYGRVQGDWAPLNTAWSTLERQTIPTHAMQPDNINNVLKGGKATIAVEHPNVTDYPSVMEPNLPVGTEPVSKELATAYGTYDVYGMHWLFDSDNFYGFGNMSDGVSTPSYINTFQRGPQESTWETVPQPCVETFKWGGPAGFLDLSVKDNVNAPSKQWKYTNAPDADARAVQAMYWASEWAKAQGKDPATTIPLAKASKMGDYLRLAMFDKYYKTIGVQDKSGAAASGYGSAHYLLSWYYAWGGPLDTTQSWAWKIGCSHSHFGYQNPVAAYALSNYTGLIPKSPNAKADWQTSLGRQLEMYRWLQSAEGAIAGGCTNSWNGDYEKYPAGQSTFYNMAYVENPVYLDPGSNTWFGFQAWSVERVAEYYYLTNNASAKAICDKWVGWVKTVISLPADGTFSIPSEIGWSGQPDTWVPSSPGANAGLHVIVKSNGTDIGIAACLAKALTYYAAATKKYGTLDDNARSIAQQLLDRIWTKYWEGTTGKGFGVVEERKDFRRFDSVVYVPQGWTGKMPNGDVIQPGVTFLGLRSKYKSDPAYPALRAALTAGTNYSTTFHRFWAQTDIALANAEYGFFFPPATTNFTITATAGTGGTITPAGAVSVAQGANQIFTITASAGYKISAVTVDGVSAGAVATYTFSAVAANHTIAATFVVVPTFTITASAGTGGTITPTGAVAVSQGANQTFAIAPLTGYVITAVTVDGVSAGAVATYTFTAVAANHTIAATFTAVPKFTITATAGTGGTITPSGAVSVTQGASQAFVITPATGNTILSVTVDGVSVAAVGTYTFINVIANHTIAVTFSTPTIFTITASAGTGGTITPTGAVPVTRGNSQAFTIAASAGYAISAVAVDGVSVGAVGTYTFSNVVANHTIAATFIVVTGCDLLTKYAVPRSSALPTISNSSYSHSYTLGTGGPSLSNVTSFVINWDLPNKGLWQLSMNTNNGVPTWWLNLLPMVKQTFSVASPACTLTGTGITGLDGDYWVTMDGSNFVMVAKSGAYALYFTSGAAPTGCPVKSAKDELASQGFVFYPNPVDKNSTLSMNLGNVDSNGAQYYIIDINGKIVDSGTLRSGDNKISLNGNVNSGLYIIRISNGNEQYNQKLIVK